MPASKNNILNILIISEAFFPDSEGGAHTYVYYLARSLLARGHRVSLITLKARADLKDEETVDGIKVYRYSAPLKGRLIYLRRPFLSAIRAYTAFKKALKTTDFDIINIHSVIPAVAILRHSQARKKPKVFTFHASMYQEIIAQKKHKKYTVPLILSLILKVIRHLEKYVLSQCSRIIVLSQFSRQQLINLYNMEEKKIKIITGAIDTSKFTLPQDKDGIRQRLGLPLDKPVFLCVRRLVARMGLENLVEAASCLRNESVDFLLLIGGRGYLLEKLKRLIKENNLENNIKLLGFVHNDNLPQYYQAADLFILPTKELEGFGLVTLESLASGVPVLGTAVGGTKEIIGKFDERFFFSKLEPKSMASDIKQALNIIKNEPELSARCRQFVLDSYSWGDKAREIEAVFKREIRQ